MPATRSCRTPVWTASRYNLAFLGALGVVFVTLAPWIVAAFTAEPEVARVATQALRIIALGFPLYAFGMVMSQSFNGAGDTGPRPDQPVRVLAVRDSTAYVLANHTALSYRGGFVAVTVAYCALALVSGWLFRRGRWKMKQV